MTTCVMAHRRQPPTTHGPMTPTTLGFSVCPTSGLSTRGETPLRASIRVSVRPGRRGMNPNGRLEVFAIGTDHAVWHKWQTRGRIRSVERLGQPGRLRHQRPDSGQLVELLQPRPERRFARPFRNRRRRSHLEQAPDPAELLLDRLEQSELSSWPVGAPVLDGTEREVVSRNFPRRQEKRGLLYEMERASGESEGLGSATTENGSGRACAWLR